MSIRVLALVYSVLAMATVGHVFAVEIPKVWDEAALQTLEVPQPNPRYSPTHVPAEFYYRVPVRPVHRRYPVYAPSKQPPGYMEWLRKQEPETVFDPARLHSENDWVQAGELVFDAPFGFDFVVTVADVQDPDWYEHVRPPLTKEGILPFVSYVVRERGKVELGTFSCGMCHTRVLPDGTVIRGAQGNFAIDRANAFGMRKKPVTVAREIYRTLAGAPWLKPDPADFVSNLSLEDVTEIFDANPPGVIFRHRSSGEHPTAIPDLIGIKDRRYLDRTGLVRHRGIGDLMRYAALNNEMDFLSRFGEFIPSGVAHRTLPDPSTQLRYSDEQLYALALFLYSLEAPANPNHLDASARRGRMVFAREGCAACHTPPLYTNNKLLPAAGFAVPREHTRLYDILPVIVGTDPGLTLHTRRGTGYYKVPSLKGVWYRGPFEHSGSVAALEDWLDSRRLRADYVPTGFKGIGVRARAIRGHEFGLNLAADDKAALLAFLRTL
jgi:hypothetical protein